MAMKKIIDFMVAAYFSLVYKKLDETTRLENALIVLTIAFGFNGLSLFFCLLPIICSIPLIGNLMKLLSSLDVVLIVVAGALIAFIINHFLNKYYSEQQSSYIKSYSEKFPKALLIFVVVVHYMASIFLFLFCVKYTSCLTP